MNNPLLLRRRMMMQQKKNSDWVPMNLTMDETTRKCVPAWTDDELIQLYGDAFKTFDKAPDKVTYQDVDYPKTCVLCYDRDTVSTQLGGSVCYFIKIYEDYECTMTILYGGSTTHTWQSQTSAKHIVCYGAAGIGRNPVDVRWLLLAGDTSNMAFTQGAFARQIHWYKQAAVLKLYSQNVNAFTMCQARSTVNSVLYMPPHLNINYTGMMLNRLNYSIICLPTVGMYNTQYNLFDTPANFKHLYLPQGLGEVRSVTSWTSPSWGSSVPAAEKYFTLHVPDMGNEEDNAALIQECRDQGWTVAKGVKYIVCDYEQTLPIFDY